MQTLLSDQQQMLQPALISAYHDVRTAMSVPDNTKLAVSIVSFILELLTIALKPGRSMHLPRHSASSTRSSNSVPSSPTPRAGTTRTR